MLGWYNKLKQSSWHAVVNKDLFKLHVLGCSHGFISKFPTWLVHTGHVSLYQCKSFTSLLPLKHGHTNLIEVEQPDEKVIIAIHLKILKIYFKGKPLALCPLTMQWLLWLMCHCLSVTSWIWSWYHSRARSTTSSPANRVSFSCSNSFICFSLKRRTQ